MTAYTGKASGDWNADGQTTWNQVGHPDDAGDTANTGAFAMTAAAAIVCGAVTIGAGGSLDTGTNQATITSITITTTGILVIGTGGVVFAGVLTGTSTSSITINGVCTGITTFNTGTATMYANVACATLSVVANETFTQAAGTQLTGMTGNTTIAGTWNVGAGCTVSFDLNGNPLITGTGRINFNGTQVAPITVTNVNAGASAKCGIGPIGTRANLKWVNGTKMSQGITSSTTSINAYLEGCDFQGTGGGSYGININNIGYWSAVTTVNCFFSGFAYGIFAGGGGPIYLNNTTFGTTRAGVLNENVTYDLGTNTGAVIIGNGVALNSTDKFDTIDNGAFICDNFQCTSAAGTPGAGFWRANTIGTIERSTTNPPAGMTYHSRLSVDTNVSSTNPLFFAVYIPIISGENISVTAQAYRSGLTADAADVVIDPEGIWFTPTTVAWDLVNDTTYYALPACAASTAAGVGQKGMVRVLFRVLEYDSAKFVDIGNIVITCGGTNYRVSMQNWQNGFPAVDEPLVEFIESCNVMMGGSPMTPTPY